MRVADPTAAARDSRGRETAFRAVAAQKGLMVAAADENNRLPLRLRTPFRSAEWTICRYVVQADDDHAKLALVLVQTMMMEDENSHLGLRAYR